ncbi:hypothetical protein HF086_018064 [Spodoptera exigua]|uniref:Origin recognition complex subunit 2 n=1 Tax=Spodoptera exigua TaxID=7107 RepID=A0A922SKG1_SPOEX|nr:hypothetical protein HF086_018064 [Spodoptera exigua]
MASGGFRLRFGENHSVQEDRNSTTESPSRRTTRIRAKPKKYGDFLDDSPVKRRTYKDISSSEEDSEITDEAVLPKPTGIVSFIDTDSSSSEEASSDEVEQPKKVVGKAVKGRDNKTKVKDSEYYIATSDHTLARLKNLNIDENNVDDIQISVEHKEIIKELNHSYTQLFNKWLYVLSENFNIILYGVGSKRSVLQQFQKQKLKDFPCIVVNGFFPSLTIKSILETIVIDLLENTNVPSNIGDVVNLIDTQLKENGVNLFLIIHNIDGTMLRNAKAQSTLAIWDHTKLSKFKFTWWDVTTFVPYSEETSYENSLMSHRSVALQLSSLKSVYQSLTTNAKGIFKIIIEYQLENQKQNYQGLPFKDLYSKCREQFLVSSDLALRAQLTEFLDHKLIKMKRTYDGSENLVIPIDVTLLQQFLDQQTS